jgi:hypothetical protein
MNKDNKSTELDNTDKKLHISDVMNTIISELEKWKDIHIEVRSESSYDKSMMERMTGGILALEKAINVVKRHCS